MSKKNIIFDMDGTILDSMGFWIDLGREYLMSIGVEPPKDLENIIYDMTLDESAYYFHNKLGVNKTPKVILNEILDLINYKYKNELKGKDNIVDLIEAEYNLGSEMCILTTSDYECAVNAMKRLNIFHCFKKIITSEILNMSKRTPEIYIKTCSIMGFKPEETIVYEDALYAIKSAKEAGCYVIGVKDKSSYKDLDEIEKIADEVL
ncbi:MAG: HAD family phosphatase [Clostridiales bacterium]|nr:HAD family phosphatase [Clostridiales bacterium]